MIYINRVCQGQTLQYVRNFEVIKKEVLRAEVGHIHFKHEQGVYKGEALNNMFYSEKEALEHLDEKLIKRLKETRNKLSKI